MLTSEHLICSSQSLWRCWAELMSRELIFVKTTHFTVQQRVEG